MRKPADGYPALAAARLALLDGVPVLPTTEEVDDLPGKLLAGELIPAKAATDAFHIAIATVHRMDFLLTCKGGEGVSARISLSRSRFRLAAGAPAGASVARDVA